MVSRRTKSGQAFFCCGVGFRERLIKGRVLAYSDWDSFVFGGVDQNIWIIFPLNALCIFPAETLKYFYTWDVV